jgi:hypothetical protein
VTDTIPSPSTVPTAPKGIDWGAWWSETASGWKVDPDTRGPFTDAEVASAPSSRGASVACAASLVLAYARGFSILPIRCRNHSLGRFEWMHLRRVCMFLWC